MKIIAKCIKLYKMKKRRRRQHWRQIMTTRQSDPIKHIIFVFGSSVYASKKYISIMVNKWASIVEQNHRTRENIKHHQTKSLVSFSYVRRCLVHHKWTSLFFYWTFIICDGISYCNRIWWMMKHSRTWLSKHDLTWANTVHFTLRKSMPIHRRTW